MADQVPTQFQEKPKPTLSTILAAMQLFDDAVVVEFDPAEIVGDLKDKIDSIKRVVDRLEFQAEWYREQAEPFMRSAYAVERNVKRLKEYVTYHMQTGHYSELPGHVFRAQLQTNAPALEIDPDCTANEYAKWPDYVTPIRRYEWNEKAVKETLAAKRKQLLDEAEQQGVELAKHGTFSSEDIPFARLNIGQHVRFYMQPPEGTKKGKK